MADNARKLVEDVLGPSMTREIWSGSYDKVLPVSVQGFELSAVLPAVFYMFRFGERRGKGKFLEIFGDKDGSPSQIRRSATIERIAERLSGTVELCGFKGEAEKAILGDLLLCFCLENVKHNLGRDQQIQRVTSAHYMASWIDLPRSISHLRYVPEMIVAMLANQKGESVGQSDDKKTWFPVRRRLRGEHFARCLQPRHYSPWKGFKQLNIGWVRGGKRIYRLRPTVDDPTRAGTQAGTLQSERQGRQLYLQSTPHCRAGGAELL